MTKKIQIINNATIKIAKEKGIGIQKVSSIQVLNELAYQIETILNSFDLIEKRTPIRDPITKIHVDKIKEISKELGQ